MQRMLIIQTAFIGDVVLASAMLESLHQAYPTADLDILVRKGNESLFTGHPFLKNTLIWNKQKDKYKHLWQLLTQIRKHRYDAVINLQRYAATGFLTAFSGAKERIGFDKNPLSSLFTKVIQHQMGNNTGLHEIERNQLLLHWPATKLCMPKLYPTENDFHFVEPFKQGKYICFAPSSVWMTKQFPPEKWIAFLQQLPSTIQVYAMGGPSDYALCQQIIDQSGHQRSTNLAGKCNFLQSAALMKDALMNYVNDSAPMHFCSSVNAPVTAIYCSTIPGFGYGPLSTKSYIVQINRDLACRPCGLHGKNQCPEGHFDCGYKIEIAQLMRCLPAT
ncbi:MAG: heptosyltransferase [Sediminibacterium sp.]|nr:MAG: heptosyltransferase [Sediminibacterium sp.] [Sediminibacterium sp. FEMGT703S]